LVKLGLFLFQRDQNMNIIIFEGSQSGKQVF